MESRRPVESYLKFKTNFVTDYSSTLLKSLVREKMSFKYFERDILNYYDHFILANDTYDDIFENFEEEMLLLERLEKINVTNKKLQKIYTIFFKERLQDDLLLKDDNARQIYRLITTTIFIALELDKYVTPVNPLKISYRKALTQIIDDNKDIIDKKIILALREKQVKLKSTFDNTITKNLRFITKYNSTKAFEVGYIPIKSCINDQSTNMSVSTLKFSIKDLDDKKEEDINKVASSNIIKNSFTQIELELSTFDVFKELIKHITRPKFILIPKDYFKFKVNFRELKNLCSGIEKYIFLNIDYEDFLKNQEIIDSLLELNISIGIRIGETPLDIKKIKDKVRFVFIEYDQDSKIIDKNLESLQTNHIKTISYNTALEELDLIKSKKFDYYV